MKPFNDFEKVVINYLVTHKEGQLFVGNLLDPLLREEYIEIATDNVTIHFTDSGEITIDATRIDMLQRKLIMTIHLLKYLDENRYITLFDCANSVSGRTIGQGARNTSSASYLFPDAEVTKLILSYYKKQVIVSEELVDFVQHNYITQEERHFRKTLRVAWAGVIASIVIGLIEMGISIWPICQAFFAK